MANLVIKPATGSGNKVIFQNQAGNVAAITVEDSGAIAIAGNATFSGTANNLGTVATMTLPTPSATAVYPEGHILQVKGTNSHGAWGPIGHNNEFHLTNIDVSITTVGLNSNFMIWGRFNADDTNSSLFGMGIGFRYYIGSTETNIVTAHEHEQYEANTVDSYDVASHQNFLTSLNTGIGTVVVFRAYGQFNNSNGQSSLNAGGLGQQLTVMEVQS